MLILLLIPRLFILSSQNKVIHGFHMILLIMVMMSSRFSSCYPMRVVLLIRNVFFKEDHSIRLIVMRGLIIIDMIINIIIHYYIQLSLVLEFI